MYTHVCVCVWGVGVGGGVLDQCKNECLFPLQCKFRNAHFYAGVQRADVQRVLRSGEAPIYTVCVDVCVYTMHTIHRVRVMCVDVWVCVYMYWRQYIGARIHIYALYWRMYI